MADADVNPFNHMIPAQPASLAALPGKQCHVGHRSPHLLAIRLRDARLRYEQELGHLPQACGITGLYGWAQVEWLDQAVATAKMPQGPGTYDPPAPYRVFRLIRAEGLDQATPDL